MLTATRTHNSPKPASNAAKVLLVEDDIELAEELAESVAAAGIPVSTVRSAGDAIRLVERQPDVQIIVTDIMLGDISGLELLRKLSTLGPNRRLQSIVLSGHSTADHILNALRLGVLDFLPKPVMSQELIGAIRRGMAQAVLAQRELTRGEAAQLLLKARRKRDSIFGADLFEDPAWNIMLDLYSSTLRGKTVTVSDLCVASGTSATTALRRIGTLVDLGLIERVPDAADRRRVLVNQTDFGRAAMDQFTEWLRSSVAEERHS